MKFPKIPIPYWYVVAIPLLSIFLGIASNQAVLVTNGDKFPVLVNNKKLADLRQQQEAEGESLSIDIQIGNKVYKIKESGIPDQVIKQAVDPDGMIDDTHCVMSKSNHLKALADWIDLGSTVASPGDAAIVAGSLAWPYALPMWIGLILRKLILGEKAV